MGVIDSTLLYVDFTSLFLTLHYSTKAIPLHYSTLAILHFLGSTYLTLHYPALTVPHSTWHYPTIALLHSTWLYISMALLNSTLLWLYFHLNLHYHCLLQYTWSYIALYWIYFTLESTLLFIDSTSLYLTLNYPTFGCTSLKINHGSTSLHLTWCSDTLQLLYFDHFSSL